MVQDSVSRRLRRRLAARAERVLDRFGLVEPRRAPPGPPQAADAPAPAMPEWSKVLRESFLMAKGTCNDCRVRRRRG